MSAAAWVVFASYGGMIITFFAFLGFGLAWVNEAWRGTNRYEAPTKGLLYLFLLLGVILVVAGAVEVAT